MSWATRATGARWAVLVALLGLGFPPSATDSWAAKAKTTKKRKGTKKRLPAPPTVPEPATPVDPEPTAPTADLEPTTPPRSDEATPAADSPAADPTSPAGEAGAEAAHPSAASSQEPTRASDPAPVGSDHRLVNDRVYRAVRARSPPVIDGVLDDAAWREAPPDSRFLSLLSDPIGQPTPLPTSVRLAYDDQHLYVAIDCRYASFPPEDTWLPASEEDLYHPELFFVTVEPRDAHSGLVRSFGLGRYNFRADVEIIDRAANLHWRAVWQAKAQATPDGWTGEYAIPWASLGLPARSSRFTIGLQLTRLAYRVGEYSIWSLDPPARLDIPRPSHFGHVEIDSAINPGRRLFLLPYLSIGYERWSTPRSRLRDFVGRPLDAAVYGGLYLRTQPQTPLTTSELELTLNPDFFDVPPPASQPQLDRFNLYYPELRQFFVEGQGRLEFGTPQSRLFHSRQIGYQQTETGAIEVPILYGLKGYLHHWGTDVSLLNVGLQDATAQGVSLSSHVSALRVRHQRPGRTYLGAMLLNQGLGAQGSVYRSYGVDGAYALLDEHLVLSGFAALSDVPTVAPGIAGAGRMEWLGDQVRFAASYAEVTETFDARLGYFPLTGYRQAEVSAGYRHPVGSEQVRSIEVGAAVSRTTDRNQQAIVDRQGVDLTGVLTNEAYVRFSVAHQSDAVYQPFTLAAGRLEVPAGTFDAISSDVEVGSVPGRALGLVANYGEGGYFGGYRRMVGGTVSLRWYGLTAHVGYRLFQLRVGETSVLGHVVSTRTLYAFTPDVRAALYVEANTLDGQFDTQLSGTWTFGELSALSLVVAHRSGQLDSWLVPDVRGLLKLAFGFSAF